MIEHIVVCPKCKQSFLIESRMWSKEQSKRDIELIAYILALEWVLNK